MAGIEMLRQNTQRLGQAGLDIIERAYQLARLTHHGQKRLSGEDYITHPIAVANILARLNMDETTIAAGLLHDTLEDTALSPDEIEKNFGKNVLMLVQGVTKLGKIKYRGRADIKSALSREIMSLRKLFFAMADDIRVIIIKLADRYHNLETLEFIPKSKQKRIALETLEIYAPIAERLGMGHLKGELEDFAFPYVYPREFKWLTKHARVQLVNRKSYLESAIPAIRQHLIENGVKPINIHSRIKHNYSLYKKIVSHSMDIERVYDLAAVRIILPTVPACYEALGIIHKFYKPIPRLIKDYIALPRPNGYQSLHTTVFCEGGNVVEIQMRTPEMHAHAENGIAAHWVYSEAGKEHDGKTSINPKEIEWVLKLRESIEKITSSSFMENIKIEFFKNRIFVFTPKGDIKELPDGSTPIDFAYAVHTEFGDLVRGARVDGHIVPLDYQLKNGQVVEIIKSKKPKPSLDWLRFVKTAEAKRRIKSYFAKT